MMKKATKKRRSTRRHPKGQRGKGGLAAGKKAYDIGQKVWNAIPSVTKHFLNKNDQTGIELIVKKPWATAGRLFDYMINGKRYITDPEQIKKVKKAVAPARNKGLRMMGNKLQRINKFMMLAKKEKQKKGKHFNLNEFVAKMKRQGLV